MPKIDKNNLLKIAYHNCYAHSLPIGHRFPMEKYELIPKLLIREGIITTNNLFEPTLLPEEILLKTHEADYWQNLKTLNLDTSHIRRIGFPLSENLINRELIIMQGTVDCALFALQYGVALNIAGGTHHAFANKGEGFCLLNDFAIATKYLIENKLASKILIIDLDVHQGNGTAKIFENNPNVFTFSMHGKHNYPFVKENSKLDIALTDRIEDVNYLNQLNVNLERIVKIFTPDFIFYQSGVDILLTDKFGKLKITEQGCRQRDELVFNFAKTHKTPIAVAMGGGYSLKISDIVNAHCNTFKVAQNIFF